MYLVVDVRRGDVWLRDAHQFGELHVVAEPRHATEDEVVAVLGDEGSPAGDGRVWVAVHAPRRLMAYRIDDDWEAAYQAMLDRARAKGWMNGAGTRIRADLQR